MEKIRSLKEIKADYESGLISEKEALAMVEILKSNRAIMKELHLKTMQRVGNGEITIEEGNKILKDEGKLIGYEDRHYE